jgi:hypothetical protein
MRFAFDFKVSVALLPFSDVFVHLELELADYFLKILKCLSGQPSGFVHDVKVQGIYKLHKLCAVFHMMLARLLQCIEHLVFMCEFYLNLCLKVAELLL